MPTTYNLLNHGQNNIMIFNKGSLTVFIAIDWDNLKIKAERVMFIMVSKSLYFSYI